MVIHFQTAVSEAGIALPIAERPLHSAVLHCGTVVTDRHAELFLRIADREFRRRRNLAIEDVSHSMSAFLSGIPCLQDGGATVSQPRDDLRTASKEHENHRLPRRQQLLHILFLLSRQAQSSTVAVLATEHHILAHSRDDDVGRASHAQSLSTVGFLTGIYLAMQHFIVPSPLVAAMAKLGFYLLRPVTAAGIRQHDAFWMPLLHTFPQTYHVGMVEIFIIHLPEIGHRGERVIAAHCPHAVSVGSGDKDPLLAD